MTVQWKKVYVFISSTFNDMHAERDYLVKHVFPRLQEWCGRRKLRLVDIDLRWGVTEADAAENKRVVQVCLERIDACRPFFLSFLGQRRGWVPSRDAISADTYAQYPGLERYAGDASVTELEILHALMNPLQRGKARQAEGEVGAYPPAEHSFFYLRAPGYLHSLPADFPPLRHVYTNEGIADPAARREADRELERWRTTEIPQSGRPVHSYAARWDAEEATPEIRLPLQCPSTAERGSDAWDAALKRWSGQWAQAGVRVDEEGKIGDATEREKAEQFNARLTRGRLAQFCCDGRPLAETILADLQSAIEARYPEHVETAEQTPLQRELDQQEQFLGMAGEGFIEREGDFAALDGYAQGDSTRPFFLTAPGGLGKTSLLARWIDRAQGSLKTGESLHYRFIGASDGSATIDALLRSLLGEIKEVAGKLREEIPAEPNRLRAALPGLLEAAGRRGKTVLVLDGLNQLESGLIDLSWLPLALPPTVKLVASFKRGEPRADAYVEELRAGGQAILAEVRPFESLDDRRRLVRAYLSQFLKELDERHLETLIRSDGAGNPLYLKVVLAELRVFGAFADLGEKIRSDFGATPVSAFAGLLRRLESDPAYSPVQPSALLPRLLGWLAHSRTGLTAEEMGGLLVREGLLPDDEAGRQRAEEAVHGLLRQVRPYLARREDRADFFYESFGLAARERYARAEEQAGAHPEGRTAGEWHASLAEYFDEQPLRLGAERVPNRHKLAELAFHQAYAGMAEHLGRTLWDYPYIMARLQASDVHTLIGDYELANLAEARLGPEARRRLGLLQGALRLSAHVIGPDVDQLPSQLTGRLLGFAQSEIQGLLEQARRETAGPWLRPISANLEAPGGALLRTLSGHSGPVSGLALTRDGRLVVSASEDGTLRVWDVASGKELRRLASRLYSFAIAVAITPGGELAVSGSYDGSLRVWGVDSGQELRTLAGHAQRVTAVASTPDGRLAISASDDKTLKVWDVESGRELRTLAGHTKRVYAVALTSDGRVAVSASEDATLKVWDVPRGKELRTLDSRLHWASTVALTPDGRMAVSGSWDFSDKAIKVWDVESGKELRTLGGHAQSITGVAVTADGRLAVSASKDATLKVWDVAGESSLRDKPGYSEGTTVVAMAQDGRLAVSKDVTVLKVWDVASGKELHALSGHLERPTAVALTPDGRLAISGTDAGALREWDLAAGRELRTLTGHSGPVRSVALTPDGRLAVSASDDTTLMVWDMPSGSRLHTLAGHTQPVAAAVLTPDGRLAVSAAIDGTLKVWDVASGKETRTLAGPAERVATPAVALTPDGRLAVSGSRDCIKVWDLASGRELRTLTGPSGWVTGLALTQHGRLAASAWQPGIDPRSNERVLKVWDVQSGTLLHTVGAGHGLSVTADGRLAVSGTDSGALKVWDLARGTALATYTPDGAVISVAAALDGRSILVGARTGGMHFLRLENVSRGPALVTAWRAPGTRTPAFGCPHCRTWSETAGSAPGTEVRCPRCGESISLNHFVVEADWRGVAAAWLGEPSRLSPEQPPAGTTSASTTEGLSSGAVAPVFRLKQPKILQRLLRLPSDYLAFICPHCGEVQQQFPEEWLGREVLCGKCRQPVRLASTSSEARLRDLADEVARKRLQ